MCGIAGYLGSGDAAMLARMSAAIAHRGPDDDGAWYSHDQRVGLAHRRLSIIDLSPAGHQPMVAASGNAVIVFNGEIYDFREHRARLEARGHRFRGHSDTEVLLALYETSGEAMVAQVNGIFAFAIYDLSERVLFLARDAMGVKPLYFYDGRGAFVFASELKALVASGHVAREIDVEALSRYLGFLWSPGGATPLSGVRRLGPGEAMRVREGRPAERWRWAGDAWPATRPGSTGFGAVLDVRNGLRTAVHRQLVADVPVGAFLSGGLDSSAVVAVASEIAPAIETFTIDTGGQGDAGVTDDLPYARKVARHLGVRLHEIRVDPLRMATDLERMVMQLDEPLADPAPLNVLYISQLARQHGVKVLLSGAGGDDIFAGYRRHRALMLERHWGWMPPSLRRGMRLVTSRLGKRSVLARRVAKAFAHADASPGRRLAAYFLWADPAQVLRLFAPGLGARLARVDVLAPLADYLETLPPELPPLQRMLALEQRFFLADHNLLYTDKMSMAAGVEVRVPLLDDDLVSLANALPPGCKQHGAIGKWVLRKAVEPYLPHEVLHRPKTGFGAPVRQWLRHELREWVGDMLAADTLRRRGLFDPDAVAELVANDRAGRIDAAYTILSLVCIEVWCRRYLEGAAA